MEKAQHEMVLDYLREHEEGMTSLQAMELFGIIQMPKRIYNLKRLGYRIRTTPCRGRNRYGKAVSFVRYQLEGR